MRTRIMNALKTAMLDKDQLRTSTLRLILAALKEREIAARGNEDEAELDEAGVIAILSKMVKQREDSIRAYDDAGRDDLSKQERAEMKIIREFLPKPLTDEEAEAAIEAAIKETGASSIRDMGKVMGALKGKYAGRMDFGKTGATIKARLA